MQLSRYQRSALGVGMRQMRISSPEYRDRSWLLNAVPVARLTLLGALGEALGFDRPLEASTTLSRHGCVHYQLMPATQQVRLRLLMKN
jgi:hypothetical protein